MSDRNEQETESAKSSGDASERAGNPVREMFLLAALYLPLGFFLWFFAASILMLPTRLLSEALLTGLYPDVFRHFFQNDFLFEIQSTVQVPNPDTGEMMPLTWEVNPMIYAWGMALLFGLIMATPLSAGRRVLQLLIGFAVVTLVTTWGVFWEAWRDLAFLFGPDAGAMIDEVALTPTVIALFYQLGYLMFPAVVPIATWILMNRRFIETEVRRH